MNEILNYLDVIKEQNELEQEQNEHFEELLALILALIVTKKPISKIKELKPFKELNKIPKDLKLMGASFKEWESELEIRLKNSIIRNIRIKAEPSKFKSVVNGIKNNYISLQKTALGAIYQNSILQRKDIKFYKYHAILDTKTTTLCKSYNNKMWDKSKKPIGHNLVFRVPCVNTHWNCRSLVTINNEDNFNDFYEFISSIDTSKLKSFKNLDKFLNKEISLDKFLDSL